MDLTVNQVCCHTPEPEVRGYRVCRGEIGKRLTRVVGRTCVIDDLNIRLSCPSAVYAQSTTRRRVPGDEAATEVKPRPAPIPEPVPTRRAKWIEQGLDPEDLASWDAPGGCVYFNLGHSIFHDQVSFFTGEWLELNPKIRLRVPADEVRNAVYEAYFEDTLARIMHVVAEHTMSVAQGLLTDHNLTIAAHGYENVQAKIESLIRTRAGRGVVTSGAAA